MPSSSSLSCLVLAALGALLISTDPGQAAVIRAATQTRATSRTPGRRSPRTATAPDSRATVSTFGVPSSRPTRLECHSPGPPRGNVPPVVTRCSLEGYAPVAGESREQQAGIARDAASGRPNPLWEVAARSTEREGHHEDGYRSRARAAGFGRQPHRLASPRYVRRGLQDADQGRVHGVQGRLRRGQRGPGLPVAM